MQLAREVLHNQWTINYTRNNKNFQVGNKELASSRDVQVTESATCPRRFHAWRPKIDNFPQGYLTCSSRPRGTNPELDYSPHSRVVPQKYSRVKIPQPIDSIFFVHEKDVVASF